MAPRRGPVVVDDVEGLGLQERPVIVPPRRRYRRGALVRRMLFGADVLGLWLAFVLANILLPPPAAEMGDRVDPGLEWVAFLLAIPLWTLLLRLEGLYDRDEERTDHSTVDDIVGVFRSVTIGVWVFALFGVATQPRAAGARPARGLLARSPSFSIPTLRAVARVLCRHLPGYTQNALIVGAGQRRPAARAQAA